MSDSYFAHKREIAAALERARELGPMCFKCWKNVHTPCAQCRQEIANA